VRLGQAVGAEQVSGQQPGEQLAPLLLSPLLTSGLADRTCWDDHRLTGVSFSRDGRTMVTSCNDGSGSGWLRFYDVSRPGTPVLVSEHIEPRGVNDVAFRSVDDQLVSAAQVDDGNSPYAGGQLVFGRGDWVTALVDRDPLAAACAVAGGGFSAKDWPVAVPGIAYRPTCPAS